MHRFLEADFERLLPYITPLWLSGVLLFSLRRAGGEQQRENGQGGDNQLLHRGYPFRGGLMLAEGRVASWIRL